ncbi:MAG: response regulator [Gammaproteobacteria bacterium]|nr:response regulator [Gammaproteobacteria bacterium]
MTTQTKILVVDDDALNRAILREFLEGKFDFDDCNDGQQCINYLNSCIKNDEELPFLILLDVNMPVMDGLEACRQIKANPDLSKIDVIFISALSSAEDRINGYEAGCFDYFAKPFHEDELLRKIEIVQKNQSEHHKKEKSLSEARSTAMTAMTNASEIGVILRTIQELYSLNTNEDIVKNILSACNVYGLKVVITIALDTPHQASIATRGNAKPIEIELIKLLRQKEAIYHFDKRTLFSYGDTSLLVLNMPIEDEDLYGRFKDHLAIIVEGAESRVKAIIAEHKREQQRVQLTKLVHVVEELMTALEEGQQKQQIEHEVLMSNFMTKIEDSFATLGLTHEQEETLEQLVEETEKGSNALFDKGAELQEKLTSIKMMLRLAIT